MDLASCQKDAAFPPNKKESWASSPVEGTWLYLSHQSIRGELEEIAKCLQAMSGRKPWQAWEMASMQAVWKYHADHVIQHHQVEEKVLRPFLDKRVKYPEQVTTDHTQLAHQVEALSKQFSQKSEPATAEALTTKFQSYRDQLIHHLQEEEQLVGSLLTAFFTPKEFQSIAQKLGQEGGHSGSWIYYTGEERFRKETMPRLGIPFFVWHLGLARSLREYQTGVLRHVQALESHTPP